MGELRLTPRLVVLVILGYVGAVGVFDLGRSLQQKSPTPITIETFSPSLFPAHVSFDAFVDLDDGKGVVERSTSRGHTSVSSDLLYFPATTTARSKSRILVELERKEADAFVTAMENSPRIEGLARGLESDPARVLGVDSGSAVVRWHHRPHQPEDGLWVALLGLGLLALLAVGSVRERRWAEGHSLLPNDAMPTVHGGFAIFHSLLMGSASVYWMFDFLRWRPNSVAVGWVGIVIILLFSAITLSRGARLGYGTTELRVARSWTGVELSMPWSRVSDIGLKASFISKAHVHVVISLTTGEKLTVLVFGAAAEVADGLVKAQLWAKPTRLNPPVAA